MFIQLIKESSGFGYGNQVCQWLGQNLEVNQSKLEQYKKGEIIEVPDKVAKSFHNAVDISTGIVISKYKDLIISDDSVKVKYFKKNESKPKEVKISEIGDSIQTLKKTTKSLKYGKTN